MNEAATQDPPVPTDEEIIASTDPEKTIALLGEYRTKLDDIAERSKHSQREATDVFLRIKPAAVALARYASGLIESVRLSRITLIELQLRLAEFEAALSTTDRTLLGSTPPAGVVPPGSRGGLPMPSLLKRHRDGG